MEKSRKLLRRILEEEEDGGIFEFGNLSDDLIAEIEAKVDVSIINNGLYAIKEDLKD